MILIEYSCCEKTIHEDVRTEKKNVDSDTVAMSTMELFNF